MCQEFNGWTNRETWATALYINNDEGMLETVQDFTITALNEHNDTDDCTALSCLAETLEGWFDEAFSDLGEMTQAGLNMLKDIGSLYRVNWREIADSFLTEQVQEVTA